MAKISGPLLDRIDMQVEAPAAAYSDLDIANKPAETSAEIKKRVEKARGLQRERFENEPVNFNGRMSGAMLKKYCPLGREERGLLKRAFDSMALSARAYHKIIKIARTIADLEGEGNIKAQHLAEAISYRGLDRKYW